MHRRAFLALPAAYAQIPTARTATAIQGVCAWPNLQRLGDGTILAMIFNQPCHGAWEGDLDCWASTDNGATWRFRGRIAPHEPGTVRMNCAAGLSGGAPVVLCSGWTDRGRPYEPRGFDKASVLRAWVCRSSDGGRTWTQGTNFPAPPATDLGRDNNLIPFGNIETAADGSLAAACYLRRAARRSCYLVRSRDGGATWADPQPLNPAGNETTVLHIGEGRWLAASREFTRGDTSNVHLELFTSSDDARTWTRRMPLSLPGQIPAHLLRLSSGRILLTHGVRNRGNYGVHARMSEDKGETWSAPVRIAEAPQSDCGYPSSVELPGGTVLTAYYTKLSSDYHYEMRVTSWNPQLLS